MESKARLLGTDRPISLALPDRAKTPAPAARFYRIYVSNSPRSQRCAARRKRVPGHPLSSFPFPQGDGSAEAGERSTICPRFRRGPASGEGHGPPLGAPRGFVSSKGAFKNFGPGERHPDPAALGPAEQPYYRPGQSPEPPECPVTSRTRRHRTPAPLQDRLEKRPLVSGNRILLHFAYSVCQEKFSDALEFWAILRDVRAARKILRMRIERVEPL